MKALTVAVLLLTSVFPMYAQAATNNIVLIANNAGGAVQSAQRAASCTAAHPEMDSGYFAAWGRNHCTRKPYGVKFDYLAPAWECFCR